MFARRERAFQHKHARAKWFPAPRTHNEEASGSISRLSQRSSSQAHVHQEEALFTSDDLPPLADSYPGGLINTSLLIHYGDHIAPHVWVREEHDCLKSINHARKIHNIYHPIDDVACLLQLPIRGKLLDHSRIKRDKAQETMVIYLGVGPMEALKQCENTKCAYAKFSFLKELYEQNLELVEEADDDDLQVTYHRECALRRFFLLLVGTSMFVDKSATHVDVAYLNYFIDLEANNEWN
ncbi:uncharacterized protein LOC131613660 [Vicia villosa]|uniref:uncharacterized protein LOC131613660 n=1 Tax=Vicia villosa TaxID=3911 RepID=UPI00273C8010|nr:uncharacterized protein LOC131613660 [Vicia villosa]